MIIRRTIEIPTDLYEQIKQAASQDRRAAQGQILVLIEEALKARESNREAA